MDDERLGREDVALVGVACAEGLPGSEDVDEDRLRRTLGDWAEFVGGFTEEHLPQFRADPDRFQGSEAYFRLLCLITVLQRDIGVRTTTKLNGAEPDWSDSRDLFPHGVLMGLPGTCSSLPPVYVSVGRRLGYPVRLVTSPMHLFMRWDGAGERYNVECTEEGLVHSAG